MREITSALASFAIMFIEMVASAHAMENAHTYLLRLITYQQVGPGLPHLISRVQSDAARCQAANGIFCPDRIAVGFKGACCTVSQTCENQADGTAYCKDSN